MNSTAFQGSLLQYPPDWEVLGPFLKSFGTSGAAGLAVGVALKRVAKNFLGLVGFVIIFLQLLVWQGFIEVKWDQVERRLTPVLDMNEDGKLSADDLDGVLVDGFDALSNGLPSVGAFVTGLVFAARMF